ncbi:MAG: threonine synthase [Clostridiales bacterium]|nr:threonine synthase [Clostridiales bacterium]
MEYTSTRNKNVTVSAAQAIVQGISEDGGLFVPKSIPSISLDDINEMTKLDYIGRAKKILAMYLTDFTADELDYCVGGAYKKGKFSSDDVAPVVTLEGNANVLELWRGPTCAFKDMALQLLPYLLTTAASKTVKGKTIVILVATSGDTGKAALEGFKDVPDTKMVVFYPQDGVSPMQKLQMMTQEGANVSVCAIEGNFDDAQSGVKKIFTDKEIAEKLANNNMMFSSANSINWGRLVPQIVYYISAYCDLLKQGKIKLGDKMNVVVPTGNFGNILAAYYAKKMGLPIDKLVCASNKNNVLTDFLTTGEYNRNREFYTTASPSMDILISSNLERLLFFMTDGNDKLVKEWMESLAKDGCYKVSDEVFKKISAEFKAGFCDDEKTKETINAMFKAHKYLCDTHTAVAVNTYFDYKAKSGDDKVTVIASTANPYKFSADVLQAVNEGEKTTADEFSVVEELHKATNEPVPAQLANLQSKQVRFKDVCQKEQMIDQVFKMLGI